MLAKTLFSYAATCSELEVAPTFAGLEAFAGCPAVDEQECFTCTASRLHPDCGVHHQVYRAEHCPRPAVQPLPSGARA